ncbi:MAG TPA: hypothetical protein PLO37_04275 [Candidatus Hydrogenedentes bacterium]|nr:hypothetical protein [Candidatus Hydrogenedentota bacterium]HPG66041.1 hypothetical protein [Candidatus Hydrogenedentota bacterium]
MSTPKPESPLEAALAGVPAQFRERLIASYEGLKCNHAEGRYEAAGLSAGKFCEVVLRLLQHAVTGSSIPFGAKMPNFADECRKLVTSPAGSAIESLRAVVPRALVFMYTMRSKRGIGHIGGDVEANQIDSATLARLADWTVCELIRVYHGLSLEEAQDLVDVLATRAIPDVWEVGGRKRVLRDGLSASEQVLLLLYSEPTSYILAEDLCTWVEYSQSSMFKRNILRPLHKKRLIELDEESAVVYLSPTGVRKVEQGILKTTAV